MAYAHGDWEFDLFRQTREFVRRHAICSGEAAEIAEAREICAQFTHLIEDDWKFDELGSRRGMATTQEDIRRWFQRGLQSGSTHLIVACDTFDHEDYPVFVSAEEDVRKKAAEYNGPNMQTVMEVYAMHLDMETQLREHRSFHYESPPAALHGV